MSKATLATDTRTRTLTPYVDSDVARKAARAWAQAHGYQGHTGGWITDPQGRPVAQGWFNFEAKYYRQIRDWVTAQVTAFDTFAGLVETDQRYCPTLIERSWRERYVADSFDLWAYQLGQARRAWRGTSTPTPARICAEHGDTLVACRAQHRRFRCQGSQTLVADATAEQHKCPQCGRRFDSAGRRLPTHYEEVRS